MKIKYHNYLKIFDYLIKIAAKICYGFKKMGRNSEKCAKDFPLTFLLNYK